MILHSQDKPFKCAYCEEHFKSRFARLKHQEKFHLGERGGPRGCFCPRPTSGGGRSLRPTVGEGLAGAWDGRGVSGLGRNSFFKGR